MITILRLGHRKERDARISTHCGLVARAFGAREIIYTGEKDEKMMNSVKDVAKRWGGPFSVKYTESWRGVIRKHKKKGFSVIHLSIYGEPIQNKIKKILRLKNVLLIIGSEKVPSEVYKLSDFNINVTQQPHSEVAALAVFLHECFHGKELNKKFKKAKIKVIPQERGKKVIKLSR